MFLSKEFNKKIKESGLSISQISKKSGVTEGYISSLVYNKVTHPDMDKVDKIANSIGYQSSEFMFTGKEIIEDLMLECKDVIESTIQKHNLNLSDHEIEEAVKNAYDYAIQRKQERKRPPIDDVFLRFFISNYQK